MADDRHGYATDVSAEERLALNRRDYRAALEVYERQARLNVSLGVCTDLRVRKRGRVVDTVVRPRPGRLSVEDVKEIRLSKSPHSHVARFYGVSATQVGRIRNYQAYRWVS